MIGLKPLNHPARKGLIAVRGQVRNPAPEAKEGGKAPINSIAKKLQLYAGQFLVLLGGFQL